MKAMRKDLGLSNNNLGCDGEKIFRALITDFDKLAVSPTWYCRYFPCFSQMFQKGKTEPDAPLAK